MKRTLFVAAVAVLGITAAIAAPQSKNGNGPRYVVEPFWPKHAARELDPRPGRRHRRRQPGQHLDRASAGDAARRREGRAEEPARDHAAARPRPPVLQFDRRRQSARSWGGPAHGYDWPKNEHGIHVDSDGNVWVGGNDKDDHQILKFTPDGKFLQQIGKDDGTEGSQQHDPARPARRT